MSLPSQSTRSSRSSAVTTRNRRPSPIRKLAMPIIVVAALSAIIWFVLRNPSNTLQDPNQDPSQDPTQVAQNDPANQSSNPATNQPVSSNNPNNQPEQRPTRIDQTAPNLPGSERVDSARITPSQPPVTNTPANTDLNRPTGADTSTSSSLLDSARRRAQAESQPETDPVDIQRNPASSASTAAPITRARQLAASGDRVGARRVISQALWDAGLTPAQQAAARELGSQINEVLVFGPVVARGDSMCEEYTVSSGDSLSRIASRRELATHWKLIQRVNRISNPSRIRLGQSLKLVKGPFHAVVDKSDHRMDIYHGPPANPSQWLYIRSFRVGLGLDDGTPIGSFVVSANKLENPGWVNPRDSRERYEPNDPDNPIGEFWLGLDGVGPDASLTGFGIHGTIEPDSIGRDLSMGCVRLADDDISLVYELLAERVSVVEIVP